jgi:hypothetical protein
VHIQYLLGLRKAARLKSGESFDPSVRFGVIESEGTLLYDNITTAYPLNLPVDYYHKFV